MVVMTLVSEMEPGVEPCFSLKKKVCLLDLAPKESVAVLVLARQRRPPPLLLPVALKKVST
jgi:hypothetical protein